MPAETRGERRRPSVDNNYDRTRAEAQPEPLPLSPAELTAALAAADAVMRDELKENDTPSA